MCFWISTVVGPLITFLIIYGLRPKLSISCLQIEDGCIKVSVLNRSCFFDAVNLRIEMCVVEEGNNYTYHFEPDHTEFLILPSRWCKRDNKKTFVTRHASKSALIVLQEDDASQGFSLLKEKLDAGGKIRVRCHAYHSFSGLGKAFEKVF